MSFPTQLVALSWSSLVLVSCVAESAAGPPQPSAPPIRAAKTSVDPIELVVENGDDFRTVRVDYHGGERVPRLVRDPAMPDVLGAIMAPRAAPVARTGTAG